MDKIWMQDSNGWINHLAEQQQSAQKSKRVLNNLDGTIVIILAYSPHFAPIELFFNILKKILIRNVIDSLIRLDKKVFKNWIIEIYNN